MVWVVRSCEILYFCLSLNFSPIAYIINAINNKTTNIENGDVIFIEEKNEYNSWNRFKEIISILSQIATLIVVIQSATGA